MTLPEITLYGEDSTPGCRENVAMQIFTRHNPSVRLLLCLIAAFLLLVPSTALARGVKAPSRAFAAPAKSAKPTAKARKAGAKRAKAKKARAARGDQAHSGEAREEGDEEDDAKATVALPIGSATLEGQKPTTPQQQAVAVPVAVPRRSTATPAAPPAAVPPAAVPTVDPTLAQVAQTTQRRERRGGADPRDRVRAGRERGLAPSAEPTPRPLGDRAGSGTIAASKLGELGLAPVSRTSPSTRR